MVQNARVNERITAPKVILIDDQGVNHGEQLKSFALYTARNQDLDLVEVKSGKVPICKMMDYGKFCFEKSKAEKHKKHAPVLKEMRFRYKTESHDIQIKTKKIKQFLESGHNVLVTMEISGRERYMEEVKEKFLNIIKELFPEVTMKNIISNDFSFSITLHPTKKV